MAHFLQPFEAQLVDEIRDFLASILDDISSLPEKEYEQHIKQQVTHILFQYILNKSFLKKVGKQEFLLKRDNERIPLSLEDVRLILPFKTQLKQFDSQPTMCLGKDVLIDFKEYQKFDEKVLNGRDTEYIEDFIEKYISDFF